MENQSDKMNKIRDRFIFVYDSNKMKWLRNNDFRYIVKGINEQTNKPFWMFDKTDALLSCLKIYTENNPTNLL